VKVRGVEEDDFRPSVHFCVFPSCFFVTMSHSGDSFWLCFAFNGRRCFPAFNGVVQKYLDPSMALDRFSLNICPFSDFFASCCHIFCQRSSVFRFQKAEHLHVRIISHHSLEWFESACFHEICSSRCLFFALLRKMRGSKQLARGGLRTQKSIGHMQKTHFFKYLFLFVCFDDWKSIQTGCIKSYAPLDHFQAQASNYALPLFAKGLSVSFGTRTCVLLFSVPSVIRMALFRYFA